MESVGLTFSHQNIIGECLQSHLSNKHLYALPFDSPIV